MPGVAGAAGLPVGAAWAAEATGLLLAVALASVVESACGRDAMGTEAVIGTDAIIGVDTISAAEAATADARGAIFTARCGATVTCGLGSFS